MFGRKKITDTPKWHRDSVDVCKSGYIYTDSCVDQMLRTSRINAVKECGVKYNDLDDVNIANCVRIKELETQLNMLKPLKKFTVVYGDGYVETVEAHKGHRTEDGQVYFYMHDGHQVASFDRVLSIIEA